MSTTKFSEFRAERKIRCLIPRVPVGPTAVGIKRSGGASFRQIRQGRPTELVYRCNGQREWWDFGTGNKIPFQLIRPPFESPLHTYSEHSLMCRAAWVAPMMSCIMRPFCKRPVSFSNSLVLYVIPKRTRGLVRAEGKNAVGWMPWYRQIPQKENLLVTVSTLVLSFPPNDFRFGQEAAISK